MPLLISPVVYAFYKKPGQKFPDLGTLPKISPEEVTKIFEDFMLSEDDEAGLLLKPKKGTCIILFQQDDIFGRVYPKQSNREGLPFVGAVKKQPGVPLEKPMQSLSECSGIEITRLLHEFIFHKEAELLLQDCKGGLLVLARQRGTTCIVTYI